MKVLLALYPAAWRRRYGSEFLALLEDQPRSAATFFDVLLGAIDARVDPQVAGDLEESVRRRRKETLMNSLRSRTALIAIGVLVPIVLYTNPWFRYLGVALALHAATALAVGLLVGRWWAPLPFVLGAMPLAMVLGLYPREPGGLLYLAGFITAWAAIAVVGVWLRTFLANGLARAGKPAA